MAKPSIAVVNTVNLKKLPRSACGQGNTSWLSGAGDRSSEGAFYAEKTTLLQ